MQRYVSYLRVSTQQQGRSGLGIEAQRKAVSDYATGSNWELIEEYVETESGRKPGRPSLDQALTSCRIHSAVLVVAKVDRLTRSSAFLHQLLDSGVDIVFCDLPAISGPTGKFLLNQMAAIAELEAAMISQRTKSALAAAKARGVKLGNPSNATKQGRKTGLLNSQAIRSSKAEKRKRDIQPIALQLRNKGLSLKEVGVELDRRGILPPRGGQWSTTGIRRLVMLG